ncbi:hypothetical protein DPMN_087205 [Dreissena polymorpha]|uniref:Uncharacterized protein n=1 Tax=Dreissena polymorpha TaxID=45954 RepID=A0A9D4KST7_DREPO|nr:hypothetical protein DPMN_087205 [Dreissena polymorpha]
MTQSADLVHLVLNDVNKAYYSQYPTVPRKLSDPAKTLTKMVNVESKKADFHGEFPSIIANLSCRMATSNFSRNVYYEQNPAVEQFIEPLPLQHTRQFLHKRLGQLSEAYTLQEPIASKCLCS